MKDFIQGVKETVEREFDESPEGIKRMLAHPDIRPCDFDLNLERWLLRLTVWGTVTIKENNPGNEVKDKIVSQDKFLDVISNTEDNKLFGLWNIDQNAVNKLTFHRKEMTVSGKNYRREFVVEIKLKDSLQGALNNAQSKGIFGWFCGLFK